MDPIAAIKKRAEEKRDYAIRLARQVYQHRDVMAIEALDRALPLQAIPEPTATHAVTNTISFIEMLIPADRPFTVTDMLGWLQATQPRQRFHETTVRTYVSRLCSRGILKKLYKNGRNYTQWVASDAFKKLGPIEAKPLVELVVEIPNTAGQPMRTCEIALALKDSGYLVDVQPATVSRSVRDVLNKHRERFERTRDGRWVSS